MTDTHWKLLEELHDGTLGWGAAVGACWPLLTQLGYVLPDFVDITDEGREAVRNRRKENE